MSALSFASRQGRLLAPAAGKRLGLQTAVRSFGAYTGQNVTDLRCDTNQISLPADMAKVSCSVR